MYFVVIFVAVFCEIFLFVKGDYINVDSVTRKAGNGLTLKIDGSFDLAKLLGLYIGDDNTEEQMLRDQSSTTNSYLRKRKQRPAVMINTMTTIVDTGMTQIQEIAWTPHKVKDSKRVHEFTLHVFKQVMKVFDNIKQKTNGKEMKARVGQLAKSYQRKFTDFVQRTREYDVRTGLGDQKVVLNTIDTSVLILQRLINFMKTDKAIQAEGLCGQDDDSSPQSNLRMSDESLQKEVDAEKELEYHHVCVKYGYCRSASGLKNVLQRCLKILATAPDDKLVQGVDAITEVLKAGDFSRILDSRTETTFKAKLLRFEKTRPDQARLAMYVLLDAMIHLNSPIEVAPENAAIAKKTTAFYNIMNELDSAIPADEANRLEWADVEKSMQDWRDGKRSDIQDIMQALMNIVSKGIKNMKPESALKIRNQFNMH